MKKLYKRQGALLVIIPFLIILIILFLAFFSYKQYIETEEERTRESFSDVAKTCQIHVADTLRSLVSDAKDIGFVISQTGLDEESISACLNHKQYNCDIDAGLVFSDDGSLIYGKEEYSSLFSKSVQAAIANNGSYISDLALCGDGVYRFAIVVPFELSDTNSIAVMSVYPQSLLQELVSIPLFGGVGRVCIVRTDGQFIARQTELEPWFPADTPDDNLDELLSPLQNELLEFTSRSDGLEYLAYGLPLDVNNWIICCSAPKSIIAERAQTNIYIIYRFTIISLILLVILYILDYSTLNRQRRLLELGRRRFNIAIKQSSRATFEYNRPKDSFLLLSECKNISLPGGRTSISFQEFMDLIFPDDRIGSIDAIKEFERSGSGSCILRIRSLGQTDAYRWYSITANKLVDSRTGVKITTGSIEDIDDREKERLVLRQKATTDSLTELYNRAEAQRLIDGHIMALLSGETSTFIILDLDDFKSINDVYGHDVGDRALLFFADRLRSTFRFGDIICRLGGDEFAVCMVRTAERSIVERRLMELSDSISKGRRVDDSIPHISCSAGFVTVTAKDSFESVYKRADLALYQAKKLGKSRSFFGDAPDSTEQ